MKRGMALCLLLLLTGCGGTQQQQDQDPYTQDDLQRDTADVYRPGESGETPSRSGPDRAETVERSRDPRVEPVKSTPQTEGQPETNPAPEVEQPANEPPKEPAKESAPDLEQPKPDPEPIAEPNKDRSGLIVGFISAVSTRMDDLEGSKAWKDFLKAKEKFDDRLDKALAKSKDEKGKDAEAAWANAIQSWYEVRYMGELFLHLNRRTGSDFEPGAGLNDEALKAYSDEQLKSADCAHTCAAYELAEPEMKDVRRFQSDVLKYNLVAGKVFTDARQEKKWATEKKKWQEATEGKFDDKDLKKYRD